MYYVYLNIYNGELYDDLYIIEFLKRFQFDKKYGLFDLTLGTHSFYDTIQLMGALAVGKFE